MYSLYVLLSIVNMSGYIPLYRVYTIMMMFIIAHTSNYNEQTHVDTYVHTY